METLPGVIGQARRGSFLDDLLVAPLGRTVAFAEDHDPTVAQTEDLDLDVAGYLDELLHVDPALLEICLSETAHHGKPLRQLPFIPAELKADATSPGRAFQHHGIADPGGFPRRLGGVRDKIASGKHRYSGTSGKIPGDMLETEIREMLRTGADKSDARILAGGGKRGVLAQEPVSGMDAVDPKTARGLQDGLRLEVALRRGGGAEADGFPCHAHMKCLGIGFGADRNGGDAHSVERADDPAGDLPAVGDEDLLHGRASQTVTRIGVGL